MAQGPDPLFGLRANDLGERTLNLGRSTLQSGGCSGKASDPGCLPKLQQQTPQRPPAMATQSVRAMAEPRGPAMVLSPDRSHLAEEPPVHHVSALNYTLGLRGPYKVHLNSSSSSCSSRAMKTGLRQVQ